MKKFRVELCVETRQFVYYEVEAKSRKELNKLLDTNCVEDIGECVDESEPEEYNEEITEIYEADDDE